MKRPKKLLKKVERGINFGLRLTAPTATSIEDELKKRKMIKENNFKKSFNSLKFKTNKKALSDVVMTVVMIALTLAVVSMVWFIVQNLIKGQTEKASDCFGGFDKLTINPKYTCFKSGENMVKILIERKDVELEQILVGISGEDFSEEIYINGTNLLDKNSGKNYEFLVASKPSLISIFPMVNERPCGESDRLNQIEECS